jgi:hypothetical protein
MTTNEVEYESHDEGDRKKNSDVFYIFFAKNLCSDVTFVEHFRFCGRTEITTESHIGQRHTAVMKCFTSLKGIYNY